MQIRKIGTYFQSVHSSVLIIMEFDNTPPTKRM